MMIFATSLLLWLLAGTAFCRVLRKSELQTDRPRTALLLAGLAILLCGAFLFRPHEDIFGGEDPGSYLNSSVTYMRQGGLIYTDPLLSLIPVEDRSHFLYGEAKFGKTKDACLWIKDMDKATMGPWFLPAYPVMMSLIARIHPPLVLYVVPLFALLTAIVLGILGMRLTGQQAAAPLIIALYLLNPLTAWNARCPRPEIMAGFFFFLAWALLLGAWKDRHRGAILDIVLSALCLSLAPFFHISALFGTLPTLAGMILLVVLGRKTSLIYLPVSLLALLGFAYITKHITDPYLIGKYFLENLAIHAWVIAAILTTLLLVFGPIPGSLPKPESANPDLPARRLDIPLAMRIVMMLLVAGGILVLFLFRPDGGTLKFLPPKGGFLILTDFKGIMRLISRTQAIAALIGLAILFLRRDTASPSRGLLLVALLPGLFFVGDISNYMMETRRLMLFVVPLIAISTGSLILTLAQRAGKWRSLILAGCAGLLIAAGFHGRGDLYTRVDYAGFYRFLTPLAQHITRNNGCLLAEYSRIGAPFEHFFGIPTLSLDNESRPNYRTAELAWKKYIMDTQPGRKVFFLTPFQAPISEVFDFIPVQEATYLGQHLPGNRECIPPCRDYGVQLRLYEMRSLNELSGASSFFTNGIYGREFDQGNMGVRRFANVQTRPSTLWCRELGKGSPLALTLERQFNGEAVKDILFFLYLKEDKTPPGGPDITVTFANGGRVEVKRQHLVNEWWTARVSPPAGTAASLLTVSCDQPALLCQANARTLHTTTEIKLPVTECREEPMTPFYARWARDRAQFLVPVDRDANVELFLFLKGTGMSPGRSLRIIGPSEFSEKLETIPDRWQWHVIGIESNPEKQGRGWVTIVSDEPWNPKLGNYPPDLAALVGRMVVIHP